MNPIRTSQNVKNNYWFKRRRYGFGWTPVTWQGFLTLIVGLGAIIVAGFQLPPKPAQPSASQWILFSVTCVVVIIAFIIIGYLKSPRPHWRWGQKPDDNPDEDF